MKKIGLVSVSIHNYGSLLQTYAMQKVLDNLGLNNDIILFKSDPIKQAYRIFNAPFMKMKLKLYKRKILTRLFYSNIYSGAKKRDLAFTNFKKNYCRFTPKTTSRDKLNKMGESYDAFVLGSDQVWNPANLEMDFYTLNFVPLDTPKIAYAPSFGVSQIPEKQIIRTKEYLDRIQHISVRELSGSEIVKRLINRDVPVVCDPTALLTVEQWNKLKSNKTYTDEKYIFCYFLGANPLHRAFANKVKELTGYKIVALQHIDEFVPGDIKFSDISPYDVGPEDFITLISNAEIVLTDSFHGTMFSIYYSKKFFTFPRYSEEKKDSTNSRIVSILTTLGMKERGLQGNEEPAAILNMTVDWDRVQSQLSKFRSESYEWLINALKQEDLISVGIYKES